jgi:hypothetical protein
MMIKFKTATRAQRISSVESKNGHYLRGKKHRCKNVIFVWDVADRKG